MEQVIMRPIGVIHSPYKEARNMPIQGTFDDRVEAWLELKEEYAEGLKDLDAFSPVSYTHLTLPTSDLV